MADAAVEMCGFKDHENDWTAEVLSSEMYLALQSRSKPSLSYLHWTLQKFVIDFDLDIDLKS